MNSSITKVIIPPPKFARLQFSFYAAQTDKLPLITQVLRHDENGVFPLDVLVTNTSDVAATDAEVWLIVCDECVFAEEPSGFDRPDGLAASIRHETMPHVNPGVSIDMKVKVKLDKDSYSFFDIGMKYSCAACGKLQDVQMLRVSVLPSLPPLKTN